MTTYTEIQADNTETAIRDSITALLEDLADPRGRLNTDKYVYQSDPRSKSADFGNYPIIYIENYNEKDDQPRTLDGNTLNSTVQAEFVIVATDDSKQQKKWHDEVSSNLKYKFRKEDDTKLNEHGFGDAEIRRNNRETGVDRSDQPVIRREITVEMNTQIDLDNTVN